MNGEVVPSALSARSSLFAIPKLCREVYESALCTRAVLPVPVRRADAVQRVLKGTRECAQKGGERSPASTQRSIKREPVHHRPYDRGPLDIVAGLAHEVPRGPEEVVFGELVRERLAVLRRVTERAEGDVSRPLSSPSLSLSAASASSSDALSS